MRALVLKTFIIDVSIDFFWLKLEPQRFCGEMGKPRFQPQREFSAVLISVIMMSKPYCLIMNNISFLSNCVRKKSPYLQELCYYKVGFANSTLRRGSIQRVISGSRSRSPFLIPLENHSGHFNSGVVGKEQPALTADHGRLLFYQ